MSSSPAKASLPLAAVPSRPTGKLSIVTTAAILATATGARAPRRESVRSGAAVRGKPALSPTKGTLAAAPTGGEPATTCRAASRPTSGSKEIAGSGDLEPRGADAGAMGHTPRTLARPSRRWGIIRKDIVPNPAMMKVNEKVVHIIQTLRKPPEDRTDSDIKLLYLWLMNQEKLSALFTTMSEISAKKLCKEMEFLHLKSSDVVVNQGEKGNTCFILVSGLVSVFVRTPDEQKKYHRVTRAAVDGSDAKSLMRQGLISFGAKVATLTPGATFGELCLIEPDSKRSATVLVDPAAQVANFIVLTAASYLRMTRSQTIEGTITDHIAFLQHSLLFRKWTKMQLMHLVNSMKLVAVPAGHHIVHKGAEADSFFVLLRGEAQECVRLLLNEGREEENRGVQHCVTVQLTFLGKFDVAGEYLAAAQKVVACPVDIRAITDVDCLVLNRKLFNLHFGGKELKKHAAHTLRRLRAIAVERATWRETRVEQALRYPSLRVPVTRRLMRLSGNCCLNCGRDTHVAGDELCMELAQYRMDAERKKKSDQAREASIGGQHRISVDVAPTQAESQVQAAHALAKAVDKPLRTLSEGEADDDHDGFSSSDSEARDHNRSRSRSNSATPRLGHRLVCRQWKAAERAGLSRPPQRPSTTPQATVITTTTTNRSRITSTTRAQHVSKRSLQLEQQQRAFSVASEVQRIRASWPHGWRDLESLDHQNPTAFERLYRNAPRPSSSSQRPSPPHTAR